jgi:hypothetical protein
VRRKGRIARSVVTATVLAALGLTACSEKLDSTGGCPTVCGDQTSDVINETFEAVVFDTTVAGTVGLGTESLMLLASRGDTVDTRAIIRFDTLPSRRRSSSTDTSTVPIDFIDSVRLLIRFDSSGGRVTDPVIVSLYNVETAGDDTSVAALEPLFTPSRLIAQDTFTNGRLIDSVYIKIDSTDFVLNQMMTGGRLRIGVQVTSTAPVMVRAYSTESGYEPTMLMRVSPDTSLPPISFFPRPRSNVENVLSALNLVDFTLIVRGNPPVPAGALAVGGLPAKRTYFRFNIPQRLIDSSIVIRATLLLTQIGNTGADAADTMRIQPYIVVAGPAVTDPTRAAQLTASGMYPLASAIATPQDGGVREIELAPAFRVWQLQSEADLPRAITIGATLEGRSPQQLLFYDNSATPELRPKLRVSYTNRTRIGTP